MPSLGIARAVRASVAACGSSDAWWHFLPSSQAALWQQRFLDAVRDQHAMDVMPLRLSNWRADRAAQLRRAA